MNLRDTSQIHVHVWRVGWKLEASLFQLKVTQISGFLSISVLGRERRLVVKIFIPH